MFELLLSATMACEDADAVIGIASNQRLTAAFALVRDDAALPAAVGPLWACGGRGGSLHRLQARRDSPQRLDLHYPHPRDDWL